MFQDWLTAFGLMLVIEGALYALFPNQMRRALEMALALPESQLRIVGLASAGFGVAWVWLVRL